MKYAMTQNQEISEIKARFFTLMSYEFRTCLNTILLSVEFLESTKNHSNNDEKDEYLQHIKASAEHMSKLLNEALINFRPDSQSK